LLIHGSLLPLIADGRFISFRDEAHPSGSDLKAEHISPNLTMGESNDFILGNTPPTFQKMCVLPLSLLVPSTIELS
jgi:hypothetical protein